MSAFALRPMLPGEAPRLAALFRASVGVLAAEDYTEAQCDAWMTRADDEAAFAARLSGALTLVATANGTAAGFASLAGDRIDMLYVSPEQARSGVATLLVDALVKLAGARKVATLTVDASDTARDLFAKLGFVAQSRNTVPIGEEWLGNTTMTRALPGGGAA